MTRSRTDAKNTTAFAGAVPFLSAGGTHYEYNPAFFLTTTIQTLTGAGAVNLTTKTTHLVTTGANALTLADGEEGQEKFIIMKTDGGAGTLTPTNLGNGTTITFDDAGDTAHLLFSDGNWWMIAGTATLGA